MKKTKFKEVVQELCDKSKWGNTTPDRMKQLLIINKYVVIGKRLITVTEKGKELFKLSGIEVENEF